ncbi:hypothetical protein NRIC_35020 [Enterococcus florum]|uniref:Gram-positive cocci surface proteins LPxTG domain-containing protein n=1 Tax=Enterococcus florum TaxID=2480627 RepID=A0A4P5PGQ3_9ENTE|nr:LPXTG cell wall anchor domain-containing protein [Enterococcus florum]GCF95611.1 hypothetical protein NRIC_35020 [Enterococcus florum]
MRKKIYKTCYFIMTLFLLFSNLIPLTVFAETLTHAETVHLEKFEVEEAQENEVKGTLQLRLSNQEDAIGEKVLSFDQGVVVKEAIQEGDQPVAFEKVNEPSLISSLSAEPTTDSSDGLKEAPLQPLQPTPIQANQLRIVVQPHTQTSVQLLLTLQPTQEQTKITAAVDQQQLSAEIPQEPEASSTSEETTESTIDSESSTTSSTENSTEISSSEEPAQSTKDSTDSSKKTAESSKKKQVAPQRAAADIKELIDQYSPGDQFIDSVQVNIPDPATINQSSSVTVNFSLPETVRTQVQIGDYYDIPLPDALTIPNSIGPNPLVDPNDPDKIWGQYTIDKEGKKIHIVLTDTDGGQTGEFDPLQTGMITFETQFDQRVINTPGRNQIIYPSVYNLPPQEITIKPETSTSVSKAGNFDKQKNPEKIIWSVDVNKDLSSLDAPTLTENFPAGTTYESVQIFPAQVDFNGTITSVSNTALGTDRYTVDGQGNISFNGTVDQAYRIVYQTRINDDAKPNTGGNPTFTNNATFNDLPASASVTADYGKLIEKKQNSYDPSSQTYHWTIQYNYGQKGIVDGAVVTDNFSKNLTIDPENVRLYYMNIGTDGRVTRGQAVPSDAYAINIAEGDETNRLTVTFNDQVQQNQAIDIQYSSKVNAVVSGENNPVITNTADTGGTTTIPSITPPRQQAVIKNRPIVEVGEKVAKWSIDINRNNYELNNASFKDTLQHSNEGYTSVPFYPEGGTDQFGIKITDTTNNRTLKGAMYLDNQLIAGSASNPDFEYRVVTGGTAGEGVQGAPYQYFTFQFVNDYAKTNDSFRVEYQTQYNQFAETNPPNPQRVTYNNGIEMAWTGENNTEYHSKSNNGFETSTDEANQGEKSGSYNPQTKEITWTIIANYNNVGISGFSFNDPITGNQVYIKDSLQLTRGTINDANGRFVPTSAASYAGEQKEEGYINVQEPEKFYSNGTVTDPENANNQLDIEFGKNNDIPGWDADGSPMVYRIVFKTTLQGQIVEDQATYENTAHVTIGETTENLPASISFRYNGETVSKDGEYDANTTQINWGIWLNRSQSLLVEPTITDNPSGNQTLISDSIEIRKGQVAANGTVSQTNDALQRGRDYSVNIITNNSTGQQQMVIAFTKDYLEAGQMQGGFIEKPYYITYSTRPNFTLQRENVSNSINVTTKQGEIPHPGTEHTEQVVISNTSGIAVGQKGRVTIRKENNNGAVLVGAKLTLTRVFANSNIPEQQLYEVTTDQSGQATFGNLVYTNPDPVNGFRYVLKETEAPDGYTISEELLNGIDLTVNQASSTAGAVKTITNNPVSVRFEKQDADGTQLSGGLFGVEKQDADGNYVQIGRSFESTVSGTDLTNLTEGKYRIYEILPPTDTDGNLQYLINKNRIAFEVREESNGQRKVYVNDQEADTIEMTNYRGSAQLYKVDENADPLPNAEFSVEWAGFDSEEYAAYRSDKRYETDNQGVLNLTDLIPGKYRVKEVAAPNGYFVNNQEFNFTIQGDASDQAPVPLQLNTQDDPLIDYLGNARFRKIDGTVSDVVGLAGAKFQLYEADGSTTIGNPVTTDVDGYFGFEDLKAGETYAIRETQAPGDFIINDTLIRFTMPTSISSNPTFITDETEKLVYDEQTPVKNYREHVRFQKLGQSDPRDNQREALAGAKYQLFTADGEDWKPVDDPQQYGADADGNFVSELDGYVRAGDLGPGSYKFVEADAPAGFIKNTQEIPFAVPNSGIGDPGILDIDISGDANVNYQGAAELTKTIENGDPLEDAVFGVYTQDDQKVSEVKSDSNGIVYASGLAPGNYYFKELSTEGDTYILNSQTIPFTIISETSSKPAVVTANNAGPLAMTNYLGAAELKKVDQDGNGLPGAVFKIYDEDNRSVQDDTTFTTNPQGTVRIDELSPGRYTFEEVQAPAGYILNSTPVAFTIEKTADGEPAMVTANSEGDLQLTNYQGSARMTKQDEAGNGLAGAKYSLEQRNGNQDWATVPAYQDDADWMTSQSNGEVTAENLAPGTYRFVEKAAPAGYLMNTTNLPAFEITATNSGALPVVTTDTMNQPLAAINYQGTAHLKKTNADNQPLAEATFKLIYASGENQGATVSGQEKLTSNQDGIVTAVGLAPGEYRFAETAAAPGYVLNTKPSSVFTIEAENAGKPQPVDAGRFLNYKGSARLEKTTQAGDPLANAVFTIYTSDDQKVADAQSDKDGSVLVEDLAPGSYYFQEVSTENDEYLVNQQRVTFTIAAEASGKPTVVASNEQGPLMLTNYLGSAQLKKVNPEGQGLEGAIFEIRDAQGELVQADQTFETTDEGIVTVDQLAPGDYTFVEVHAPGGYLINTTPVPFTIVKTADGEPTVVDAGTLTDYQGSAKLIKQNEAGDQLLAGASFNLEVQDADGDWGPVAGQADRTTEEDGAVTFDRLAPGTYRFVEKAAPENYILNTEDLPAFVIPAAHEGSLDTVTQFIDASGEEQVLTATNYQGTALLQKTDDNQEPNPLEGATFKVVYADGDQAGNSVVEGLVSDANGIVTASNLAPGEYRFVETESAPGYMLNETPSTVFTIEAEASGKPEAVKVGTFVNFKGTVKMEKVGETKGKQTPLAGAEFELYDVTDDSEGQLVTTSTPLISDEDGGITITGLSPADYELREVSTSDGFIVNTEPIDFEIKSSAPQQEVKDLGKFVNYKQQITLTKQDQEGKALAGAEFELLSQQGNPVPGFAKVTADEQGIVSITDIPQGNYRLKETKAPEGYLINTQPVDFEISRQHQGQPDVIDLGTFVNYQGQLRLTKENQEGDKLRDAIFQLLDKESNVLEMAVGTDRNGVIELDKLAPGTYYFKETIAPNGYQKEDKRYEVTIPEKAAGEPKEVEIQVVNKRIPPNSSHTPNTPNAQTPGSFGSRYPRTNDRPQPWLMGLGTLMLVGAGWIVWKRKKHQE